MNATLATIQELEAAAAQTRADAASAERHTAKPGSLDERLARAEAAVSRSLAVGLAAAAAAKRSTLAAAIGAPKTRPGRRAGR